MEATSAKRANEPATAADEAEDAKRARTDAGEAERLEEEGEEDSDLEEGEIAFEEDGEDGARARASEAWILDLKKPASGRVVRSPLQFACESGKPLEGMWLEFGVFSGRTINLMAEYAPSGRKLYGFDTFSGLPEDWRDTHKAGHFDCNGKLPKVAPSVCLVEGLFQDTLEPFLAERTTPADARVAVAHLDADLYSATIYVLQKLAPRIVPGTLLVFDELINYNGFEEHEWKALLEAVFEFGWEFEWIAQSGPLEDPVVAEIAETQQVALRITKVGKSGP